MYSTVDRDAGLVMSCNREKVTPLYPSSQPNLDLLLGFLCGTFCLAGDLVCLALGLAL